MRHGLMPETFSGTGGGIVNGAHFSRPELIESTFLLRGYTGHRVSAANANDARTSGNGRHPILSLAKIGPSIIGASCHALKWLLGVPPIQMVSEVSGVSVGSRLIAAVLHCFRLNSELTCKCSNSNCCVWL